MSKTRGARREYWCANDCQQQGCQGHSVQCISNASTDQYEFVFENLDGFGFVRDVSPYTEVYDERRFHAMVSSYNTVGREVVQWAEGNPRMLAIYLNEIARGIDDGDVKPLEAIRKIRTIVKCLEKVEWKSKTKS